MKAFHKNKTKKFLPDVRKILLAVYALIKRIFESSSLKTLKYVHGQAANSRLTVWQTLRLCLLLVRKTHGGHEV